MGGRGAELSICVRCSLVQAGTWGLPPVEPELLLLLPESACERIMQNFLRLAMTDACGYPAVIQGQHTGSTSYCTRHDAPDPRPAAHGSPCHLPPSWPTPNPPEAKKQFFERLINCVLARMKALEESYPPT